MQAERLSTVGLIAASVVHEVNNPLSGVRSLAAALDDESMSAAKRKEYHAAIREGLGRMAETMRGLLDLAREQPLTLADIDSLEVVSSCLRLMAASLRAKGIAADLRIPAGQRLRADRAQLMQAVLNLLVNAADATPTGGRITLTLRQRDRQIGLAVTDTGTGIPKEIATRVLEPFFTTKPTGKGTGLGLAIVNNIMKAHKGSIEIDSNPGKGTTIILWLPIS
jgi:signal transduction histidine kinase